MFGNYFKHVLILTLLAGVSYALPQVKDAMAGAFTIGFTDSAYTAATGDITRGIIADQVTVKSIEAKVAYNSSRQETAINITAKVQVTATREDMYLTDNSFVFSLTNQTLKMNSIYTMSSSVVSNLSRNSATNSFLVKKGTTALFSVTASRNPQSMIAGQYFASLVSLNNKDNTPAAANKSNLFVVVGENSPYITMVGRGIFGTKDNVVLNAVRLGKTTSVTIQSAYDQSFSKTFTLQTALALNQIKFNLANYAIPAGNYYLSITNPALGAQAGKSNSVYLQVLDQSKILTAKVTAGKLAMTYDTNRKEVSMAAPFNVTIKATDRDLTFTNDSFQIITSDANNYQIYGPSVIQSINNQAPVLPYILKAGQQANFVVVGTIYQLSQMFAGTYTMSMVGIWPTMNNGASQAYIQVSENKTTPLTIVGETSPYISSLVTSGPIKAGEKIVLNGQRLSDISGILLDGVDVYPTVSSTAIAATNGTSLSFVLPLATVDGFHMLQLKNINGASNIIWFESTGGVAQTLSLTVISPNGGEKLTKGNSFIIGWRSTGKFTQGFNIQLSECTLNPCASAMIVRNYIPGAEGTNTFHSYSWDSASFEAGSGLANIVDIGQYKITVSAANDDQVTDSSDNYLTISSASTTTCYTFIKNLTLGDTGPDIVALQAFLSSHGFQGSSSFQLGVFDESTKIALMSYQTSKGLPATGFAGPLTLAALNADCGGPVAVPCPIGYICTPVTPTTPQPINCPVGYTCTVVSPTIITPTVSNSSTSVSAGTTNSTGTVVAYPISFKFNVNNPNTVPIYLSSDASKILTASLMGSASGSLTNILPQVVSGDTDAAYVVPAGSTRVFIVAGSINSNNTSGANVYKVNQVNFGTNPSNPTGSAVTAGVENLTASVTFSGTTPAPSITVTSPIGGSYVIGSNVRINWVNNNGTSPKVIIYLQNANNASDKKIISSDFVTGYGFINNVGSFIWNVEDTTSPGTYNIVVANGEAATSIRGSTASTFTINSASAQSITALAPSSNVTWTLGQSYPITWSSANVNPSLNTVKVWLKNSNGAYYNVVGSDGVALPNTGSANITIPNNGTIPADTYSIEYRFGPAVKSTAPGMVTIVAPTVTAPVGASPSTTYGTKSVTANGATVQSFIFNFNLTAGNNPIYISKSSSEALVTTAVPAGMTITPVDFSDNNTNGDGSTYFYLAPGQTKSFTMTYQASAATQSPSGVFGVTSINYGTSGAALTTNSLVSADITNGLRAILFH